MKSRLPVACAAVLVIGALMCPRPSARSKVDPGRLFLRVYEAERDIAIPRDPRMRDLIERNYMFSVSGEDAINGQRAWVLGLRPKIKHRPWRQLWIDQQTHRILAQRDWSSTNELRRAVGGVSDPEFRTRTWEASGLDTPPAIARYVPQGFEIVGIRRLPHSRWQQTVYSDGLYAISIFQRFPGTPGREHDNATAVYCWGGGLLLHAFRAGRDVVVIGDLSADELNKVAASAR